MINVINVINYSTSSWNCRSMCNFIYPYSNTLS
nr:MAG TPA: hypothetical protein [Crassvirales sp.]